MNHLPINSIKDKNIAILIPLTIPASGKSTLFNHIQNSLKEQYEIYILSSDGIRSTKMAQLLEKQTNLSKKQAYYRTKDSASQEYYLQLKGMLSNINKDEKNSGKYLIFMDKNYSQNTLEAAVIQIRAITQNYKNLNIKVIGILPECKISLHLQSQSFNFLYPFSLCYIAFCLKRVVLRKQHDTLEGTEEYRVSVCLFWANSFANFLANQKERGQYFDSMVYLPFTLQQPVPKNIQQLITTILLKNNKKLCEQSDEKIPELIQQLKNWQNKEIGMKNQIEAISNEFRKLFDSIISPKII